MNICVQILRTKSQGSCGRLYTQCCWRKEITTGSTLGLMARSSSRISKLQETNKQTNKEDTWHCSLASTSWQSRSPFPPLPSIHLQISLWSKRESCKLKNAEAVTPGVDFLPTIQKILDSVPKLHNPDMLMHTCYLNMETNDKSQSVFSKGMCEASDPHLFIAYPLSFFSCPVSKTFLDSVCCPTPCFHFFFFSLKVNTRCCQFRFRRVGEWWSSLVGRGTRPASKLKTWVCSLRPK